ncbi:hypothetical protein Aros01_02186 [Streptosporangium roseum]|uniref:Uncharacterized protein n=1 Tax=Streptosporangium roseum (strain ATCC 12428 / DSM 43021 / JCM 3005 / KCTC 9067 / NCIMB 10171 / NRRL 2505 / NI 9100) TaxID=479432 RepID=D2B7R5_STRRD|nr:hypothetical protein Sros_0832 [Streptosporangium roseum DSM 43021]
MISRPSTAGRHAAPRSVPKASGATTPDSAPGAGASAGRTAQATADGTADVLIMDAGYAGGTPERELTVDDEFIQGITAGDH